MKRSTLNFENHFGSTPTSSLYCAPWLYITQMPAEEGFAMSFEAPGEDGDNEDWGEDVFPW